MTEDESDFLNAVWRETRGKPDERVALTDLPAAVLALVGNGYIELRDAGPSTWQVTLRVEGQGIARTLFPRVIARNA